LSVKQFTCVLFLLTFLFSQNGCSELRDPLQFCSRSDCSYSIVLPGMISISEGEDPEKFFLLTEKGLKKINFDIKEGFPLAYDLEKNICALKKSDMDGFSIKIFDVKDNKNIVETSLPETVSSIFSGCFLKNGSLAMLLLEEKENLSRRYFLSLSEGLDINNWRSYLIREETSSDLIGKILSLGSSFERPVSIQCSGDRIFIHTLTTFSDMIQSSIYRFDVEKRALVFETGYYPLNVKDGTVSIFFNEKKNTGYVHQKRELVILKGSDFPVKTKFDEPGEVFFSPASDGEGLLIYFIPETKDHVPAKARIMQFD